MIVSIRLRDDSELGKVLDHLVALLGRIALGDSDSRKVVDVQHPHTLRLDLGGGTILVQAT